MEYLKDPEYQAVDKEYRQLLVDIKDEDKYSPKRRLMADRLDKLQLIKKRIAFGGAHKIYESGGGFGEWLKVVGDKLNNLLKYLFSMQTNEALELKKRYSEIEDIEGLYGRAKPARSIQVLEFIWEGEKFGARIEHIDGEYPNFKKKYGDIPPITELIIRDTKHSQEFGRFYFSDNWKQVYHSIIKEDTAHNRILESGGALVLDSCPEYDGTFLYPPRIEHRLQPTSLIKLDNDEYIAQPKLNGSNTSVTITPDKVIAKERHNTFFAVPPKFDFRSLYRGNGNMCICGEFMNKSKKGVDGLPFSGFVIWDITAYDGKVLLGTTPVERLELLDRLYPSGKPVIVNGLILFYHTDVPGIYKINSYLSQFYSVYQKIIGVDMIEGLVLKRKNSKLKPLTTETNNMQWAVKVRKPTKNYKFESGGGLQDYREELIKGMPPKIITLKDGDDTPYVLLKGSLHSPQKAYEEYFQSLQKKYPSGRLRHLVTKEELTKLDELVELRNEKDNGYLTVVNLDKLEHWLASSPIERMEYFEELVPREQFNESEMFQDGGGLKIGNDVKFMRGPHKGEEGRIKDVELRYKVKGSNGKIITAKEGEIFNQD